MTERRFVLVDFRYTNDVVGHVRFCEAGNTYDMPRTLAYAAAKRELVAVERPIDWEPPSILRPPEVLTEAELAAAEAELQALRRHAFEIVNPELGEVAQAKSGIVWGGTGLEFFWCPHSENARNFKIFTRRGRRVGSTRSQRVQNVRCTSESDLCH